MSIRDIGKNALSDVKNRKTTYVTLLGKDGAFAKAEALINEAVEAIKDYEGSEYLVEFALRSLTRKK